jgi:hypothetical protein
MLTTLIVAVFVLAVIVVLLWFLRTLLVRVWPADIVDVFIGLLALIAVVWLVYRYSGLPLP